MQRSVLAGWVAVLCSRAVPAYWRDTYRRLAIAIAVWALGHSLAGRALSFSDYRAGGLTDLGWIVPFLLLAALAIERRPEQVAFEGAAVSPYPLRTAASLAALAAVPAFDALFAFSGHPALDLGRERLTRVTVFVVGLLLAAREVLAHREAAVTRVLLRGARNQLESAARRNRMLGVVGSAVHELAGVLSGVRSLLRLILSQPDLPQRARAESERAQQGTSAAAGIVRNLTALVRRTPDTLTLVSLNDLVRHVVEARRADLAQEGIELQLRLASELPSLPVDGPALQQVLGGLIDNGAVAIRSAGRRGVVEVSTHGQDGRVLLRVADDGPGLSEAARRSLAEALTLEDANWSGSGMGLRIAREVVALHGGTLSGRNRVGGGAELEILLPLVVGRQEEQTG
jgi:signal transduction histidine kinase